MGELGWVPVSHLHFQWNIIIKKEKKGQSTVYLFLVAHCVFIVSCKMSINRCYSSFLNEIFSQSKDIHTLLAQSVLSFFLVWWMIRYYGEKDLF